jgi:hypothetical protein
MFFSQPVFQLTTFSQEKKNMRKIFVLKSELKQLAHQIQEAKTNYKQCQREHNGCDGYLEGEPGHQKWIGGYCSIIKKLKHEFRHKHIAYCLLRGRTIDEIERPAEDNKPDQTLIQEITDAYREEDVCACQA